MAEAKALRVKDRKTGRGDDLSETQTTGIPDLHTIFANINYLPCNP